MEQVFQVHILGHNTKVLMQMTELLQEPVSLRMLSRVEKKAAIPGGPTAQSRTENGTLSINHLSARDGCIYCCHLSVLLLPVFFEPLCSACTTIFACGTNKNHWRPFKETIYFSQKNEDREKQMYWMDDEGKHFSLFQLLHALQLTALLPHVKRVTLKDLVNVDLGWIKALLQS